MVIFFCLFICFCGVRTERRSNAFYSETFLSVIVIKCKNKVTTQFFFYSCVRTGLSVDARSNRNPPKAITTVNY